MKASDGVKKPGQETSPSAAVAAIDYANFKDAVAERQGEARAQAYADVWSALYGLGDDVGSDR